MYIIRLGPLLNGCSSLRPGFGQHDDNTSHEYEEQTGSDSNERVETLPGPQRLPLQ